MPSNIENTAHAELGFPGLRPGQKEAVAAVLAKHDTLVVHPTGSGKSAIYQIAGFMMEGATVVVSPLIALQKNQVDSLPEDAVAINSAQPAAELREGLRRTRQGEIEFILLAPEQLHKPETIGLLKQAAVSLFVVDEAHCVSQWGHDFRPDYLRIGAAIDALGHPRVLALTATASPEVRQEIIDRLHMRKPKIFVRGFDRPNLFLRVDSFPTEAEKLAALIHRVRWADKPGIVYAGTRKAAEEIVARLAAEETAAVFYHAGLKAAERETIQNRFMNDGAEVIVATNAFGMGIDKATVRFVYHYDPPVSLDAYYQEAGRAGRDGNRAEAALFYRRQDLGAQAFKTGEGKTDPAALERLAEAISEEQQPAAAGLSPRKLAQALQQLEDAGAVENPAAAAQTVTEDQEERQAHKREQMERMRAYAESTACRRETLLRYFGDDFTGPCHFCDRCQPNTDGGTRREVV